MEFDLILVWISIATAVGRKGQFHMPYCKGIKMHHDELIMKVVIQRLDL